MLEEPGTQALWIGTQSDGILKYDRARHQFIRYRNDPTNPESLAETVSRPSTRILEGVIWVRIGCDGAGPFFAASLSIQRNFHTTRVTRPIWGKLLSRDLRGFAREPMDGTTGALSRLDRKPRSLYRFAVPAEASEADAFCHLLRIDLGALWIWHLRARPLSP